MIDEGGNIVAVNHVFTVGQAKQIGARRMFVDGIGLIVRQAGPGVLDNNVLPPDGCSGIDTISMNLRSADHEGHMESGTPPTVNISMLSRIAYDLQQQKLTRVRTCGGCRRLQ